MKCEEFGLEPGGKVEWTWLHSPHAFFAQPSNSVGEFNENFSYRDWENG